MADEKSPSHDDVMKDTVDASEAPEETTMDEANVDLDSPDPEDSEQDASADDGDSASLETQVEELREALLRSQADLRTCVVAPSGMLRMPTNMQSRSLSKISWQCLIPWIARWNWPRPLKGSMQPCSKGLK